MNCKADYKGAYKSGNSIQNWKKKPNSFRQQMGNIIDKLEFEKIAR